jgi:hypothetical protein
VLATPGGAGRRRIAAAAAATAGAAAALGPDEADADAGEGGAGSILDTEEIRDIVAASERKRDGLKNPVHLVIDSVAHVRALVTCARCPLGQHTLYTSADTRAGRPAHGDRSTTLPPRRTAAFAASRYRHQRGRRLRIRRACGGQVGVEDLGGEDTSLLNYMQLPVEQYTSDVLVGGQITRVRPTPFASRWSVCERCGLSEGFVPQVGTNLFVLAVPRLQLFDVWLKPEMKVVVEPPSEHSRCVRLMALDCTVTGSPFIEKLGFNELFVVRTHTTRPCHRACVEASPHNHHALSETDPLLLRTSSGEDGDAAGAPARQASFAGARAALRVDRGAFRSRSNELYPRQAEDGRDRELGDLAESVSNVSRSGCLRYLIEPSHGAGGVAV